MVKSELVERISQLNPEIQRSDCRKVVETFFDTMINQLATGGDIELRGFGRLFMSQTATRTIRNPRSGSVVSDQSVAAVRFRTGKPLLALLNGA